MHIFFRQLISPIVNSDSYKPSHKWQYQPGTEFVSSYIEARGGELDATVLFGLQAFLKEYLSQPIDQKDIDLADILFRMHGVPFYKEGWQHILDKHQGRLPIEVRAVPEGTIVPTGHALVEIINTDPDAFWLTSYVETALLRAIWYPTTVATKSYFCKETMLQFLEDTCDDPQGVIPFMLHDFGARAATSAESSALGGMGHQISFMGSDTILSVLAVLRYYEPDFDEHAENPKGAMIALLQKMEAEGRALPASSIPAAEHSTITSWGMDGETDAYKNMLTQFAGEGKIVAVVSDSYDLYNALENIWGGTLRDDVINNGGRVVIRPDSGVPIEVVCRTLEILEEKFGCTVNSKGYKVLPPYIRVIQGDGVSPRAIAEILQAMKDRGYSAENVAFGMGGELLQKVNRDNHKFVQKASAGFANGAWYDIFKDPKTDPGKSSKKGRLSLVWDGVAFATKRTDSLTTNEIDRLTLQFRNGEITDPISFDRIKANAAYFSSMRNGCVRMPVYEPWNQAAKLRVA